MSLVLKQEVEVMVEKGAVGFNAVVSGSNPVAN